jgi:putative ABC transport system permease protein
MKPLQRCLDGVIPLVKKSRDEAFAKMFGWNDPIGKKIPGKNFEDHEIIGMVKDFNYQSLYTKVEPLVMGMNPGVVLSGIENINVSNNPIPKLFVRLKAGNASETLAQIETIWDKLTGGEEFGFQFVDETLNAQYRGDQNLGKIVSLTTILAMLIGSLGLYGLASLAMQNRTKEISIRKVLGASEQSLLVLLSKDYILLIVIWCVRAIAACTPFERLHFTYCNFSIDISAYHLVSYEGLAFNV